MIVPRSTLLCFFSFFLVCFSVIYVPGLQRLIISFNYIQEAPALRPDFWNPNLFIKGFPYLDAHCVIAAIVAERDGIDTSKSNPYDIWNRGHSYGKAWLLLKHTSLGLNHTELVGVLLALIFYLSATMLCVGLSLKKLFIALSFGLSPPIVLAVNRGHVDFLIFTMILISSWLLVRFTPWRVVLAMLVNLFAAFLKFFPAAVILWPALVFKGKYRILYLIIGAGLVGIFIFLCYNDIPKTSNEPWMRVSGPHTFGAAGFFTEMGFEHPFPMIFSGMGLIGLLALIFSKPPKGVAAAETQDFRYHMMVQSGIILVACFFMLQNYSYRLLFAMGMLPWVLSRLSLPIKPNTSSGSLWGWLISLFLIAWIEFIVYWSLMLGHLEGSFSPPVFSKVFGNFLLFKDIGSWVFVAYTMKILYDAGIPRIIDIEWIARNYLVLLNKK